MGQVVKKASSCCGGALVVSGKSMALEVLQLGHLAGSQLADRILRIAGGPEEGPNLYNCLALRRVMHSGDPADWADLLVLLCDLDEDGRVSRWDLVDAIKSHLKLEAKLQANTACNPVLIPMQYMGTVEAKQTAEKNLRRGDLEGSELDEDSLHAYVESYVDHEFIQGRNQRYIPMDQFELWIDKHRADGPLPNLTGESYHNFDFSQDPRIRFDAIAEDEGVYPVVLDVRSGEESWKRAVLSSWTVHEVLRVDKAFSRTRSALKEISQRPWTGVNAKIECSRTEISPEGGESMHELCVAEGVPPGGTLQVFLSVAFA